MADYVELLAAESTRKRNIRYQESVNQQNIAEEERRYQRERADAKADLEAANRYNDPAQQMTRLRQAGLNPNLVYGKGAETTSATIRGANGGTPNIGTAQLPQPRLSGNDLGQYYQNAQTQAQTDQTNQVTQNLKVDSLLKTLELAGKSTSNANALIDYDVKKKTASAAIKKLWADADLAGLNTASETQNFQSRKTLKDLEISQKKQNLTNSEKDAAIKDALLQTNRTENEIKQWQLKMEKKGLNGSDPMYLKSFLKFLLGLSED